MQYIYTVKIFRLLILVFFSFFFFVTRTCDCRVYATTNEPQAYGNILACHQTVLWRYSHLFIIPARPLSCNIIVLCICMFIC